ncbi:MAG: type II secretion system protein [Patescibacteria group bacterium]|nr:type II secretion system protein [Patescibacteria group bacterium]
MFKNNKGFTLVELLVVIAIIGILATVAVTSLNGAREQARDAKRISDVRQMSTALELHYTAGDTYTGGCDASEGDAVFDKSTDCTGSDGYITWANFKDPSFDAEDACESSSTAKCSYGVQVDSDGGAFAIYFWLEKGTNGLDPELNKLDSTGNFTSL